MKTLEIIGLNEKPRTIECGVRVLGKPELFDPLNGDRLPEFDHLFGVSPNGQWMALVRNCNVTNVDIYTIAKTEEGAGEMVVPSDHPFDRSTRPRDVANDGTFLYQASVSLIGDSLNSRRPFVFKPGDKEPVALPPKYDDESPYSYMDKGPNEHVLSHTPYCFAGNGRVFGWTHTLSSLRASSDNYELVHCIWRQTDQREWTVEYMPDFMRFKWVWPARDGKFFCCAWSSKEADVEFGAFDGTLYKPFENFAIHGHDCKIVSVATDGTCIGQVNAYRKKKAKDECDTSFYTFLARPAASAFHVFNESAKNDVCLTELSENGKYILAEGCKIFRADNDGYQCAAFNAPGWRIDDTAVVTNEGYVFATATCLDRNHGCFRLKLPVLLVPQW